jgi:hypothetical protein
LDRRLRGLHKDRSEELLNDAPERIPEIACKRADNSQTGRGKYVSDIAAVVDVTADRTLLPIRFAPPEDSNLDVKPASPANKFWSASFKTSEHPTVSAETSGGLPLEF